MVRSFLHPQEIEAFYILPTLRRHIVMAMKKKGAKQSDIAKLLHIKDAAVSQYITTKRGNHIEFSEDIVKEVEQSAERIHDTTSFLIETQMLLEIIRRKGFLCHIHQKLSNIPSSCNPEVVGCVKGGIIHAT